jgi:hypothetical protein
MEVACVVSDEFFCRTVVVTLVAATGRSPEQREGMSMSRIEAGPGQVEESAVAASARTRAKLGREYG